MLFGTTLVAQRKGTDDRNKIKLSTKLAAEYHDTQVLPPILASQTAGPAGPKRPAQIAGPAEGAAAAGMKLIGGPEQPSQSSTCVYVLLIGHEDGELIADPTEQLLLNPVHWSNSGINRASLVRAVKHLQGCPKR